MFVDEANRPYEVHEIEYHIIESAGHNLHHDKPEIVMEIMELFLERTSL